MGHAPARVPQSAAPARATIDSPVRRDHVLRRQITRRARADSLVPRVAPKIEDGSKGLLSGLDWIDQRGSKPYPEKPASDPSETCARCCWKRRPAGPTERPAENLRA